MARKSNARLKELWGEVLPEVVKTKRNDDKLPQCTRRVWVFL